MSQEQGDRTLHAFLSDRNGATAIEYSLIAAGIAAAIVATIASLGTSVNSMWQAVSDAF